MPSTAWLYEFQAALCRAADSPLKYEYAKNSDRDRHDSPPTISEL